MLPAADMPEHAPKTMFARITAYSRPPRVLPVHFFAAVNVPSAMPDTEASVPTTMNKGMTAKVYECDSVNNALVNWLTARSKLLTIVSPTSEQTSMEIDSGIPSRIIAVMQAKTIRQIKYGGISHHLLWFDG